MSKNEDDKPEVPPTEYKEWSIKRMKVTDLKPADYNPRIIMPSAKDGLKKSIEKFGLVQQIVWNKRTGNVVGGHQRLRILTEQGNTEVDVTVVDLPKEDEVALNIALNSPIIQGDFTEEAVKVLEDVSGNLQGEFNALKLHELQEQLQARFVDDNQEKKPKKEKKEKPLLDKSKIPDERIVVTCPKCKSEFRKSDKKVLYDATKYDNMEQDEQEGEEQ